MKYLLAAFLLCLGGCGFLMGAEKGLTGDHVPAVGTNGNPADSPSPLTLLGYGLGAALITVVGTLTHGVISAGTLKPLVAGLAASVPASTHEIVNASATGALPGTASPPVVQAA